MRETPTPITDKLDPLSAQELRQVVLGLADFENKDLEQVSSALSNVENILSDLKDNPKASKLTTTLESLKTELTELQEHLEFGKSECDGTCHAPDIATTETTMVGSPFNVSNIDMSVPEPSINMVSIGDKKMDENLLPIYLNDMFESIAEMEAVKENGKTLNNDNPSDDISTKLQRLKTEYAEFDPEKQNIALDQKINSTANILESLIEENKQQGAERRAELESYFTR